MADTSETRARDTETRKLSRREMIAVSGAVVLGGGLAVGMRQWSRYEHGMRANVFLAKADSYQEDLAAIISQGLSNLGVTPKEVCGKRILLKPNLVETSIGAAHINTNPAMVVAAADVFRRFNAREVIVGEGQGHRRDSLLVLDESGMGDAIDAAGLPFVDLNHDDIVTVPNRGHWTKLDVFHLPRTIRHIDWVVTMPKLKTHHWVGVTCAMKNQFGVLPGIAYGWPKNVLHHQGIDESIMDIHATVLPSLAIVDGIVGMEGDGPIMGSPKAARCIIMGRNLPAVDATAVRVMGLNPYAVGYLAAASGKLGPIHEHNITQTGASIESLRTRFDVLDAPYLRKLVDV